MNKFILPENRIDIAAIEEAIRTDAWLVIPNILSAESFRVIANNQGFDGNAMHICDTSTAKTIAKNSPDTKFVILYADIVLSELLNIDEESNDSSVFMTYSQF